MSDLQRNLLKSKLPPMVPRPPKSKTMPGRQKDYSPAQWNEYFHDFVDVKIDDKNSFRCYRSEKSNFPDAPVIILLHGGGFNALSWAVFTTEITQIINCQCIAIDFRGHGDTVTDDDDDLSAETMATDIANVLKKLYENESAPNFLLVGHSMGGAIAVNIAHMNLIPSLLGMCVIDVVEGTALEALQSMQSFLRSRPNTFRSIQNAIEWCVRSGQVRNIDSAKVSMPGQIINCETKKLATSELPLDASEPVAPITNTMTIPEDAETEPAEPSFQAPKTSPNCTKKYTWRIDLSRSEKFWLGWFEGLSDKFLEAPIPKLLLLAGIDNLDKKLTVGQMQGKFQLQVLARSGHAVHEDQPHQVAETIATYLVRNRFATSKENFVYQMPMC